MELTSFSLSRIDYILAALFFPILPGRRLGALMPRLSQDDLLAAVVQDVRSQPDHPVTRAVLGQSLVGLQAARVGLASLPLGDPGDSPLILPVAGDSARNLALRLLEPGSQNTGLASLAMAAANALLPPPAHCTPHFGQEVMAARGRDKAVAVIGHFPFVDAARSAYSRLWVLEKQPQPGDCDASQAAVILPRADVVAITATTLLNGSLAGLLDLCRPQALVILLGPTTPFAPSLFDCGIDVLAGCDCSDGSSALAGVAAGRTFRNLPAARQLAWEAPRPS